MSICTRMHSAILSTTVYTPFIAIAYEHKTVGFMESLHLKDWVIDIHDFSYNELQSKFDRLMIQKESNLFVKKLGEMNPELQKFYSKAISTVRTFMKPNTN